MNSIDLCAFLLTRAAIPFDSMLSSNIEARHISTSKVINGSNDTVINSIRNFELDTGQMITDSRKYHDSINFQAKFLPIVK